MNSEALVGLATVAFGRGIVARDGRSPGELQAADILGELAAAW